MADHGTRTKYNQGCRCESCKAATRAAMNSYRANARLSVLAADDPRHGTVSAYGNLGCRCELCRAANAASMRSYRSGK